MPVHQQGWFGSGSTDTRNHVDDDFTCDLKNGTRVKRDKWFYIGLCKQDGGCLKAV